MAGRVPGNDESGWSQALGFLAGEILGHCGSRSELRTLQLEILIPLEFRLMDDPAAWALEPGELVAMVQAELGGRPSGRC